MKQLGLSELDSRSYDWERISPLHLSTRCCATGTCDGPATIDTGYGLSSSDVRVPALSEWWGEAVRLQGQSFS